MMTMPTPPVAPPAEVALLYTQPPDAPDPTPAPLLPVTVEPLVVAIANVGGPMTEPPPAPPEAT